MNEFDTECLHDIERRRDAGFAPSAHERDFLIKLVHRMSDWQPKETAPRDREILLYCSDIGYSVSYWSEAFVCFVDDECNELHPTDWMPLPEPPTTGKER